MKNHPSFFALSVLLLITVSGAFAGGNSNKAARLVHADVGVYVRYPFPLTNATAEVKFAVPQLNNIPPLRINVGNFFVNGSFWDLGQCTVQSGDVIKVTAVASIIDKNGAIRYYTGVGTAEVLYGNGTNDIPDDGIHSVDVNIDLK